MKVLSVALNLALVVTLATAAWAGTYLDTAALLLDESHRSAEWVRTHLWDDKLATIAHELAEARVKSGRAMSVPHEVAKAHPHLLLSLEASERAMAAATEGEHRRFLQLLAQAREEERNFREILGQQKLTVPDVLKDKRACR
jgi:recombinational DNA repair ATPase RecF